ncbi:hypothetical protein F5141DRAFT_1219159 [Pisolithus sp. B1]|nr:hypothetical protein F5141DRAFT_1219159 [Pisolithus sp. B1]
MEALKAEIAVKRKTVEAVSSSRPTKYMRRGRHRATEGGRRTNQGFPSRRDPSPPLTFRTKKLSADFVQRVSLSVFLVNLTRIGRLRLRALELLEEKDHERQSGQNDFKKALEDVENVERELRNKNKEKRRGDTEVGVIDLDLVKTDPDKLYPLIYYALKRTLKEWEESMDERPEHVKRSTQGKLAAAIQVQSAEYLKPLFKTLRSRSLPSDMLVRIAEIEMRPGQSA